MSSSEPDHSGGGRPPADPDDIRLRYTHEHSWYDTRDDEPESWHVSADVLDDTINDAGGEGVVSSHVGDIRIVRIDPYRGDAFGVLDGESADLSYIGEVVLNPGTSGLNPELETQFNGLGTELLVLDHIRLAPEWRGFGIGVVLAGLAIQRLSGGCQAAICYPASLTNEEDATTNTDTTEDADVIDREDTVTKQARAKLSAVWSQLGFEHFHAGVHVLDLGTTTLDEAVEQLRERISRLD